MRNMCLWIGNRVNRRHGQDSDLEDKALETVTVYLEIDLNNMNQKKNQCHVNGATSSTRELVTSLDNQIHNSDRLTIPINRKNPSKPNMSIDSDKYSIRTEDAHVLARCVKHPWLKINDHPFEDSDVRILINKTYKFRYDPQGILLRRRVVHQLYR